MKRHIIIFFSSGAYLGYSPIVPGTVGSLAGVPVYLALSRLPAWGYILGLMILTLITAFLAGQAEVIYGRPDDRRIVIDEVVGLAVTMTGLVPSLVGIGLGFILFRLFDIVKPWPASFFDRSLAGGWGIVLDDVVAGLYAAGVLRLILYLQPSWA